MVTPPEVKGGRTRLTPAGSRLILTVVAAGCVAFLLTLPRPTAPRAPALVLDPAAVAIVREEDRRAAAATPESAAVEPVWELYREGGRAELAPESAQAFRERAAATQEAIAALVAEDPEGLDQLRARATMELPAALRGDTEDPAVLGSFPATTERYGVFEDGEPVAPAFVVRTLFAGRFNAIMGQELTAGMSEVERTAYWGWLAVEAPEPPAQLRARAREELAALDADQARLTAAFDAYESGLFAEASALYERGDTLRERNFALAAASSVP
ncbi:MAG: hypothetical protein CMN30_18460 [Sandaracinus sp.]|nr:hypothetical protein [Sandaracinus sp.]|tara:strand:+ start:2695 stop:3507 length:813 start_codon:yes stop_codon:yes gene_type:complete